VVLVFVFVAEAPLVKWWMLLTCYPFDLESRKVFLLIQELFVLIGTPSKS
jgi:hypothetical protein